MEQIRINRLPGLAAVLATILVVGCENEEGVTARRQGAVHQPGNSTAPPGFLWKPTSETNNKLVVLLPSRMTGKIVSTEVHSDMPPTIETLLEAGWFAGVHNGSREHWRFQQHGSSYGKNVYAMAMLDDGTYHAWLIADGGIRTEF